MKAHEERVKGKTVASGGLLFIKEEQSKRESEHKKLLAKTKK